MRLGAFLFFGTLLLLAFQTTLSRTLQIGAAAPDFYLLFVVYLVGILSPSRALVTAWGLGLLRDCLTPAPLGADAGVMLLVAGLLVAAHRRFVLDTDLALAFFTFVAGLTHGALWAAAMHFSGQGATFGSLFLRIGLPVAVYTALLMPPFARVANRIVRPTPPLREIRLS